MLQPFFLTPLVPVSSRLAVRLCFPARCFFLFRDLILRERRIEQLMEFSTPSTGKACGASPLRASLSLG